MTTVITKLNSPISVLISYECGSVLSERDAGMLDYCQQLGEVYVGYVDGDLICCWGIIPPSYLSTQAYIWMWASGKVPHQLLFIRHSVKQVRQFLSRYETLTGHCKLSEGSAQRWLHWLGAEFGPPADGLRPFVINRST